MSSDFNIAPSAQMLGAIDPRLNAGASPTRQGQPQVVEAEVVDVAQGRAVRPGAHVAEVRMRQRAQMDANRPVLSGPTSYGADGKPRYIIQSTPGSILSIFT